MNPLEKPIGIELRKPESIRQRQLLFGSYPELATRDFEGAREWYAAYLETYLEKDLRMVYDIGKLSDFKVFVRLLAARTAQEINAAALSRDLGISAKTVESWISVLEAAYLAFRLLPFHGNLGKRLIKRPKLYFWDTGLVCHLTGQRTEEALDGGPLIGSVFETLVVAELQKRAKHLGQDVDFFFYRDNNKHEVDMIVHNRDSAEVALIEIKSGYTAKAEWADALIKTSTLIAPFFEKQGAAVRRRIIYRGESKTAWPRAGVDFVNWMDALSFN